MIVAKFGGTSVATAAGIRRIHSIISHQKNKKPLIVVSALAGITDLLYFLATAQGPKNKTLSEIREIHINFLNELTLKPQTWEECLKYLDSNLDAIKNLLKKKSDKGEFRDKLVSYGEIIASHIIAAALSDFGLKASQVVATEIIVTDDNFGGAEFVVEPTRKNAEKILKPLILKGIVPVVTGFIGATRGGKVTTLGRGGSDYTASILGFCLKASEIQVWKDVDGIYTTDPRLVKGAINIPELSFREASEMAAFGAKVLHPRTIRPAVTANIPVRVLNSFYPNRRGTVILSETKKKEAVTAISFKRNAILINMYSSQMLFSKGFLARIFNIFSKNNISIDLVSVTAVSVSVTLDNEGGLDAAVSQLSRFTQVSVFPAMGIVSLIGEGIIHSTQTSRKIFDTLDKAGILVKMSSLGASDINVSVVVESKQVEEAVRALHKTFFNI